MVADFIKLELLLLHSQHSICMSIKYFKKILDQSMDLVDLIL